VGTALLFVIGGAFAAQPVAAAPERSARTTPGSAAAATYGRRHDVLRLAAELARTHELDADWVASTLAQARRIPAVTRLIMPAAPGQPKSWQTYRNRFIEPRRIHAGARLLGHPPALAGRSRQRYGVPPERRGWCIIGVETYLRPRIAATSGCSMPWPRCRLDFPTGRKDRSAFFRDELGHFLRLGTHRAGWRPQRSRARTPAPSAWASSCPAASTAPCHRLRWRWPRRHGQQCRPT
jgi:membrane-bound lytic murein transglycosylase B